jgi:hypothetical protein
LHSPVYVLSIWHRFPLGEFPIHCVRRLYLSQKSKTCNGGVPMHLMKGAARFALIGALAFAFSSQFALAQRAAN